MDTANVKGQIQVVLAVVVRSDNTGIEGLARLRQLEPSGPVQRYQWTQPCRMVR
jgi:hypothetical protein